MARKKIQLQNEFPYHVFNRMADQRFFEIPINQVWRICENTLYETAVLFGIKIHAFVLMGNHYHMAVTTPEANLSDAMEFLQSRIASGISLAKGCPSVRFQSRYKWSIAKRNQDFLNLVAYIYLNPVRAKITEDAGAYRYSTLNGILGYSKLRIPVFKSGLGDEIFWKDPFQFYVWAPATQAAVNPKKVQTALRRAVFEIGS
jgi:putative transposase